MKTYCKLKENLQLVHSIYFMEAGHHMHLFASELFDDLDTNNTADNKVLLNAHFHNSIEGIANSDFTAQELRNKLSIDFADDPSKYAVDTLYALDYLAIDFRVSENSLMLSDHLVTFLFCHRVTGLLRSSSTKTQWRPTEPCSDSSCVSRESTT